MLLTKSTQTSNQARAAAKTPDVNGIFYSFLGFGGRPCVPLGIRTGTGSTTLVPEAVELQPSVLHEWIPYLLWSYVCIFLSARPSATPTVHWVGTRYYCHPDSEFLLLLEASKGDRKVAYKIDIKMK